MATLVTFHNLYVLQSWKLFRNKL